MPISVVTQEPVTEAPGAPAVEAVEPEATPTTPKPKPNGSEALTVLAAMEKDKNRSLWVPGSQIPQAERIPTGLYDLDVAIGGGLPRGRIVIMYGKESSLKTTFAMKAAAQVQKQKRIDNKAVLVDLEGTHDAAWAKRVADIDNDALIVVKPSHAEECADIVEAMVHSNDVGIIIVDSLGVFAHAKELKDSAEDRQQGGSAWVGNAMVRKIIWGFATEAVRGHRPCVVLINQPRMAVGSVPYEWMPAGKLQLSQSALTLKLTGKPPIIKKEVDPLNPTWHPTSIEVKKAKVGVTRRAFDIEMCMLAHDKIKMGQTDTWTTVATGLKEFSILQKTSQGWLMDGKTYSNLLPIHARYHGEPAFQLSLQQRLTNELMKRQFVVA